MTGLPATRDPVAGDGRRSERQLHRGRIGNSPTGFLRCRIRRRPDPGREIPHRSGRSQNLHDPPILWLDTMSCQDAHRLDGGFRQVSDSRGCQHVPAAGPRATEGDGLLPLRSSPVIPSGAGGQAHAPGRSCGSGSNAQPRPGDMRAARQAHHRLPACSALSAGAGLTMPEDGSVICRA